jgi:hypothetical protein
MASFSHVTTASQSMLASSCHVYVNITYMFLVLFRSASAASSPHMHTMQPEHSINTMQQCSGRLGSWWTSQGNLADYAGCPLYGCSNKHPSKPCAADPIEGCIYWIAGEDYKKGEEVCSTSV